MRRLILPVLVLALAVTSVVLADRTNNEADPGRATAVSSEPALVSPILSARRAPTWLRAPKSDSMLSDAIGAVLQGAPSATCVLVERDDEKIAANNTGAAIRPGALQRLLTITALDAIGQDVAFRTEVAIGAEAEISEEGVLDGDIWLIGGADPVLSTTDYISRFGDNRAYTDFGVLAADTITALQDLGITTIGGSVVGDETKYSAAERDYVGDETSDPDGEPAEVWTDENAADNAVGPLSALLLNDGFDDWPGPIELEEGSEEEANEEAEPAEEQVLDASLNTRSRNPAISAAAALDDALEEAGFTVNRSATDGEAPPLNERDTLAEIDSPPLTEILERAFIDATTAEMLLKEIGVRSGLDSERGLAIFGLVVLDGFNQADLPFELGSTHYHDGSGRSDHSRTTCDMVHATIVNPVGAGALLASPVAESPVSRCAPTTLGQLSVIATVTESTTGLTGHFVAANGDRLSFALMVDDADRMVIDEEAVAEGEEATAPEPLEFCNPIQAAMLDAIAGHPYGPDLADLSPLDLGAG